MHVEVLANPSCPHCTHVLDEVTEAAVARGVPVAGVDLERHPELALELGFETSPLVRVGARVVPGPLDPDVLQSLLDEAAADESA